MTNKNTIEKELNLMQKLMEIQSSVKVPKSQYSDFGGYNYRSCEDILKAVKPLNMERGLLLILTDVPVFIEGRFYIKATATLTDGKDTITVDGYAREAESKSKMDDSQVTGSASSYARKYALNGLYLIDDGADADALNQDDNHNQMDPHEEFIQYLSNNVRKISELTSQMPEAIESNILDKNGFDSIDDVPPEYYSQVYGYSKVLLKKAEEKLSAPKQEPVKKQSARDLFANGGKRA